MYSKLFKIEAVKAYLQGTPPSRINAEFGIKGSATLYGWVRLYQTEGLEGFESHTNQETYVDYSVKLKVIKWRPAFYNQVSHYR